MVFTLGIVTCVLVPITAARASSPQIVSTSVLFVGRGVGVIAAEPKSGCGAVFLTADFSRWRNVSPPNKFGAGSCLYNWTSASFSSPKVGWILGRNTSNVSTILEHTTNGGRTWSRQPGDTTGGLAGEEVIDFVNASVGWRQQFSWTSNSFHLQRTTNGGASWTTRAFTPRTGCPVMTDVFSSSSVGFAGSPLAGSTMGFGSVNYPYLWRTVNGGITWTKMTVRRPASLSRVAIGLYGLPDFSGRDGTLPVDYVSGRQQDIFFYSTKDEGRTWTLVGGLASPLKLNSPVTVNVKAVAQACYGYGTVSKGSLASVSLATPTTWWVLRPGPTGRTERFLIEQDSVARFTTRFLPATTGRALLQADSYRKAMLTLSKSGGSHVYVTVDGGAGWYLLFVPSVHIHWFSEAFGGGGVLNQ